ncbi:histone acetyltransferase type b catalytic [Niveomyces insectorum RCEF 264]|uniref:Histone acetyltransferase type B catalytic subunit n=1 Tax=Niveomyces insectorum RCEF 264 TaxID=1081102 RepID=A0A162KBS8_9HYPO|nr:histone acetyltransferase type b catalytic [Niveomyces insectorum RCEF 264]
MEHSYDDWVSNANEALEISLVQPGPTALRTIASFNPKFTYSIFGDEETIFGYQNLKINLRYHASDMRPNLRVSASKKLKNVGEHEPTDIPKVLGEFLPPVAFQKPAEFEEALQQSSAGGAYTPPGERIATFQCSDGRYEVWKGTLSDPAVTQLVNRIQIFVPFFIEGGVFIHTDGSDNLDRWTVFCLYRTRQQAGSADAYEYEFAGYATVYRFLLLPFGGAGGAGTPPPPQTTHADAKQEKELLSSSSLSSSSPSSSSVPELQLPADGEPAFSLGTLPCRSRISQFLLLPPFQGKGHAGRLYRTIYDTFLHEPQTREVTVEDPNEAFDDVRDLADLAFLSAMPGFAQTVRLNTAVTLPKTGPAPRNIVDPAALETLRHQAKMAPRQFSRVVEMYLMQHLAPSVRPSLDEADDETAADEAAAALREPQNKDKAKDKAKAPTAAEEHAYRLWRSFVKQRLYRHNKEILGQLERSQRIDKLEETLVSVELEYARLLSLYESRAQRAVADQPVGSAKRKLQTEDEDKRASGTANGTPVSKKVRIEDVPDA